MAKLKSQGFTIVTALLVLVIVAAISATGWYVWRQNNKEKSPPPINNSTQPEQQQSQNKPDPYEGWQTYVDTGYTLASGVRVKHPPDWQVKVGGSNAFGWRILQNATPNTGIGVRSSYLDASETPQNEWDNCPSADACGPVPGDIKLEGNSSTINGLDSYSVKMQNSSGIYYATIIKGNKPASDGTVVFLEFILYKNDPSIVNIYKQIVASTSF